MKRTFQNVSSISLPPLCTMINGRGTKTFRRADFIFHRRSIQDILVSISLTYCVDNQYCSIENW